MKGAKWLFLPLCLPLLFFLIGCGNLDDLELIDNLQIIESTIAEDYDIDTFDFSNIEIQITKKSGDIEIVSLKEEMLSVSDLEKLSTPGTHSITISYLDHELTFVVTMKFTELKTKLLEIYQAAQTSSLTYEEWLESIKGADGLNIVAATINEDGHLILTLCNDSVIDAGYVLGIDGKQVTFRINASYIEWQYVGDPTWTQLIPIEDLTGPIGIGVSNLSINLFGELIITYTDETIENLGRIYTYYIVQFKDSHGYLLDTQRLIYGEDAVAPVVPTKEGYLIVGWDIEYTHVTTNLVVTAIYSVKTYSVAFDSHGGSACDPIIDIRHGSTIDLPIPTKDGFIFAGWYRSNLVTGSPFYSDSFVQSNLTLYARWTPQDYQIQFVDDDESILSTQYIRHQESVVQPVDPVRLGYSFLGWYADQAYTTRYDFTTNPTSDLLIFAQWELDIYQIEYILNDGTNAIEPPTSYTVHSETFGLLSPTRFGYEFVGWYINSDYTGDPLVDIVTGSTGHLTLYAKWELIYYAVTYELDGGQNNSDNVSFYTSFDLWIVIHPPTKVGYVFNGWIIDPVFQTNQESTTYYLYTFMQTSAITLSAQWELAEYDVVYFLDGGINNIDNPTSFTILSESVELLDPIRPGCIFLGWYEDSMFEDDPILISEIQSGTARNIYLYARWEVLIFNINYILDGGVNHEDNMHTYHANLEYVILFDPEREGYTFLGWYDNSLFENEPIPSFESSLATDITLYAKWEITNYDIFYNLGGGENNPLNPSNFTLFSENIQLLAATKLGYTFMGWYDNDEFEGNPILEVTTGTNHSLYLYAKWEITYYEISYHLDDGYNSYANPNQFTIFDEDISIYEPYKQGYNFLGWYGDSEFTGEGVNVWVIYSGSSENLDLFAKWELILYDVIYHLDGGTNNPLNPANYSFSYENIDLLDATKAGYTFLGWYDNDMFIGSPIYWISADSEQSLDLYAKWEITYYEITYHLYDGYHNPDNPIQYTIYAAGNIYFYEPYKPGYVFLGWYEDPDALMPIGTGGDWYIYSGLCQDIDLYAMWILNQFSIDYVLDGGTNSVDNLDTYNVEMEFVNLYDPVREGYIFEGWYDNPHFDGSAISIVEINPFSIEDIIFYASWSVAP